MTKLALGTVQFGMPYGISNTKGVPSADEIKRILARAADAGALVIDTAAAYGASEEALGRTLPLGHAFRIVTKTLKVAGGGTGVVTDFHKSLAKLGQKSVYGLLVHDAEDLLGPGGDGVFRGLCQLRAEGLVRKIGVSVYSADQIDRVTARYAIDLIQLPFNFLDQRLLKSGHLAKLKAAGVEVHARSVFLQGALLMPLAELPSHFDSVRPHLARIHDEAARAGHSLLELALGFVLGQQTIDQAVVGVCSENQLVEILAAAKKAGTGSMDFSSYSWNEERILNPALWPI